LGKTSKGNKTASSDGSRIINILLIVGALAIAGGVIWWALKEPTQVVHREVLPKPNVTTLDPAKFSGKTRFAYEAAREVPEVLAQLPCYCGCMSGFGHRSNLDCFHDEHGVECSMCQDIALDARDLYNSGMEISSIRQFIKDKYNRYGMVTH
jgi:hypothetical protein